MLTGNLLQKNLVDVVANLEHAIGRFVAWETYMRVDGKPTHTIWLNQDNPQVVQIIDQRDLPHRLVIEDLCSLQDTAQAIRDMHVRGAPLIGVTAAYGMYLAALNAPQDVSIDRYMIEAAEVLRATRPTAVNLTWALERQLSTIAGMADKDDVVAGLLDSAHGIKSLELEACETIGRHGVQLIEEIAVRKGGEVVNILTHCNAGWLACVDFGTATAPIYEAHRRGVAIHVWVDETRPRNQGARLTAWELGQEGVPHTVIVDNVGGHLMQHDLVDLVLVGSDRTTHTGDVANKIGTYLKALAAHDNGVPFYVALPTSTIDWEIDDGVAGIPIEQRGGEEVSSIRGLLGSEIQAVQLTPNDSSSVNYAFDVTPARLVTGLITELGVCKASCGAIHRLVHGS